MDSLNDKGEQMGALVKAESNLPILGMSHDHIERLTRTVAAGTSNDELQLFLHVCKHTGLDPFRKQIYAVMRSPGAGAKPVMVIQTGIDGIRSISERSGKYEGTTQPQWCGEDGIWKEIWAGNKPPTAAKIGVYRKGFREPIWGIAHWEEFVQTKANGDCTHMWSKMGAHMLAKVAEAQAHRKAFPESLSAVYAEEEMQQAEIERTTPHEDDIQANAIASDATDEFTDAIKAFAEMKAKLGAETYYRILGSAGFEHAHEMKARALRVKVYKEMASELKRAGNV